MRKQIIELLDQPHSGLFLYDNLKDCVRVNFYYEGAHQLTLREIDEFSDSGVDHWFAGCIQSLFYRPNKYALVMVGDQGIGKTEFFKRLLPWPSPMYYNSSAQGLHKDHVYSSFILDYEFSQISQHLVERDEFTVITDNSGIYAEKRLASYCGTSNSWNYPPRKSIIVLNVIEIDWERFNDIDKTKLWIELFNTYKISK